MTNLNTEPRSFEDFEADANAPAQPTDSMENVEATDRPDAPPVTEDDGGHIDQPAVASSDTIATDDAQPDAGTVATAPAPQPANRLTTPGHDPNHWTAMAATPPPAEAVQGREGAAPDPARFEQGEADPAYTEARVRWVAGQEFELRQAQADRAARIAEIDQGWNSRVARAGELYPDFDEVVVQAAARGAYEISEPLALGIKASPVGPDIAWHLATHPAEASRISRLPIPQAAYEFGKLEARMEAHAESRRQPIEPLTRPTMAPTPPTTLARGAGGRFAINATSTDFAAFEAAERARHKR
jgi:hypothetical protein